MNAALGVSARGFSRVAARNASTQVSLHVIDVPANIISPAIQAGFCSRMYGSVPIAAITVSHIFSPVLYVTRVDGNTEVSYSWCALRINVW